MPVPSFIELYDKTDDFTKLISFRCGLGPYQATIDIQIDWGLGNPSEAGRVIYDEGLKSIHKRQAEHGDADLSPRTLLRQEYDDFKRQININAEAERDIYALHFRTQTIEDPVRRSKGFDLCAKMAKEYGIEYPPANDTSGACDYDPYAMYVLNRVIAVMTKEHINRISLHKLSRSCKGNSKEIKAVLKKLEEDERLELDEQIRSGKVTTWIKMSSMEFVTVE